MVTCSSCSSNSVNVICGVSRDIAVDYHLDGRNIQSPEEINQIQNSRFHNFCIRVCGGGGV